jgi:hypothetical protein
MGEYEPDDSRDVTYSNATAPGEPPRTGPREDAAREQALAEEARDKRSDQAEQAERRDEEDRAAIEQS